MNKKTLSGCAIMAALILPAPLAATELPDAIAVKGETLVATIHAQGAQVYECAVDASGKPAWKFREPIATLLVDGKTVGRHYAGPNWELSDGSAVVAKVAGRVSGAFTADIPLLKLEVIARRGSGQLSGVTTIQRLNTKGGVADGVCAEPGTFLSVPYVADYVFYKKVSTSMLPSAR